MFSGTQKPTPPTVFNLQASDWVHREEETGVYYQLSWFTYKLAIFVLIFKVVYFAKKIRTCKKIVFIYGWQKIFTNKNIFSKHNLHALFISFFSKIHNKKNIYPCMVPLSRKE